MRWPASGPGCWGGSPPLLLTSRVRKLLRKCRIRFRMKRSRSRLRVREPEPRGILAGGAIRFLDRLHVIFEPHVRRATGFRDRMPFDGRDRIDRRTASGGENARKTVLRNSIAA